MRHVVSRSEFYTAYTPYQAEISQGILQAIYEYQTMIAGLTGMQVANASMYDGASAMAEAAVLAAKSTGRTRIVLARSIHPEYRQVVRTYAWSNGYEIVEVEYEASGQVDLGRLAKTVDEQVGAVIVQSPNFFGVIEDVAALAEVAHSRRSLMISGFTEATSLGILKPPGASGADIVVGEGQAFGNPLNYGGPLPGDYGGHGRFPEKKSREGCRVQLWIGRDAAVSSSPSRPGNSISGVNGPPRIFAPTKPFVRWRPPSIWSAWGKI